MRKIILVGFMSAGKTSMSMLFSEKYNISFFDTDVEIEKKFNLKIDEIFNNYGETFFRKQETFVLEKIQNLNLDMIVSTGGGTPIYNSNMKKLNKIGKTIYLENNFEILYNRILKCKIKRPIFDLFDLKSLKKIYYERTKTYSQANFKINCENKTPNEILNEISNLLTF